MNTLIPSLLTVLGLILFEIVSSIDNAVINTEVLVMLPPSSRRWFVRWGLLLAVIGMRGVLPWLIVWLAIPSTGILGPLGSSLYQDPANVVRLHTSGALLLMAAGTALLLIFCYWLFMERAGRRRSISTRFAGFVLALGVLAVVFSFLATTSAIRRAVVLGVLLFLVLLVAKRLAALPRQRMSRAAGRRAKILYLEVLDSIFSIEGVLGAFAFTFSVPLILIGNGIGAIIVRNVTMVHGPKLHKVHFLKTGAMYALGLLSVIMLCDGFGTELPGWLSFLTTIVAMGFAYLQQS